MPKVINKLVIITNKPKKESKITVDDSAIFPTKKKREENDNG